jgi:Fe-S cluster assembly protein SufD
MMFETLLSDAARDKESWRYTPLAKIIPLDIQGLASPTACAGPMPAIVSAGPMPAMPSVVPEAMDRHRLVFVNGHYDAMLSKLDGLPADILTEKTKGHYVLSLAGQVCLAISPLELYFIYKNPVVAVGAAGAALTLDISLGASSRFTLVEHHIGDANQNHAAGMTLWRRGQIDLAPHAKLTHTKIIHLSPADHYIETSEVKLAEGAFYDQWALLGPAGLARLQQDVRLGGQRTQAHLHALLLGQARAHHDVTTIFHHQVPATQSQQQIHMLADDKAHTTYQGKVIVAKEAQKTDSQQLCRTLLLSDQATANAKPELEIYADDVKCSHGATMGDLDADQLFYLMARGLSKHEARALLLGAFAKGLLENLADADLRQFCEARITSWLAEGQS